MLALAAMTVAHAHAFLLSETPTDGAVMPAAPRAVVLTFSEPVTPFGNGISVYPPSGRSVAQPAVASGESLSATLDTSAASESGTYVVDWRVTAQDTHPSRGNFTFSVGHRSAPYSESASFAGAGDVSAAGVILQTLSRWLHFIGYAAAFGSLLFVALVLRGTPAGAPQGAVRFGIVLLLVAPPLSVIAQAASLGSIDSRSLADVTASPFGRVAALQLGGALLLWAALPAIAGSRQRALIAVPLLALAVAAADGLGAHAATDAPAWLTSALTAVHVAAMGVWVGGVAALLLTARRESQPVRDLARRFAPLAAGALVLAVASGAVLAILHLRSPTDFAQAPYGVLLAAKIALVAAAMTAALMSRRRLRPFPAELLAMVGILALAAALGSLPPIR